MPFDAGFAAAVSDELKKRLTGAKIEKIQQPERDEILLSVKNGRDSGRLFISAKSGSARIGMTTLEMENPQSPPMFCMLLRKHLSGGVINDVVQLGFERAVELRIGAYNELGFPVEKSLILETTGRYHNIILCGAERKIISALRLSSLDMPGSEGRSLIAGFPYEPMPLPEARISPIGVSKALFEKRLHDYAADFGTEQSCEKYLLSAYAGLSPLTAREITFRTLRQTTGTLSMLFGQRQLLDHFYLNFAAVYAPAEKGVYAPYLIKDKNGEAIEFSFCEILQYGSAAVCVRMNSFSEVLDAYFGERDLRDRLRRKSQDIFKLLSNAEARIRKKENLQREDIAACARREEYKKCGDLITANMYLLKKGMKSAKLTDYLAEGMPEVEVALEENLTPAQNAQRYYKKYNKMKATEENLTLQLEQSAQELAYIDTVFESLTTAQNEADLEEIREELRSGGYGKKLDAMSGGRSKERDKRGKGVGKDKSVRRAKQAFSPMTFVTSGGYRVLCGKNNLQNDYVTTVAAGKNDYWFHVKGMPGSHVVMLCGDTEPEAEDFTECATIAAYYSSGKNIPNVAVDYTRVRHIRKPSGAKPGYVIYDRNYSAYVTADEAVVAALRQDGRMKAD